MEWMAGPRQSHLSLGWLLPNTAQRYWEVPPEGVFFRVSPDGQELVMVAVRDARRVLDAASTPSGVGRPDLPSAPGISHDSSPALTRKASGHPNAG